MIKKLVILGGGTAGWLCSAYLSKFLPSVDITVIESSKIGSIGVGEGSTPHLKVLLDELGITEQQWMPQCDATYKSGIYFRKWNHNTHSYFHPFYSEMDIHTAEVFFANANARRRGNSEWQRPDDYFLVGHAAAHHLSPKVVKPMVKSQEYGYHFDASKLAAVLQQYAIANGVQHIDAEFELAERPANGALTSLRLKDGQNIKADFFVDASGFNALLLEQTLKVPFISFADELLNDCAVTVALPPENNTKYIPSKTESIALAGGWCWKIPLSTRTGTGYVYSAAHLSQQQAEQQLAVELGLNAKQVSYRHLKMKVGCMQSAWHENVAAIGLAQSFIEPIEATSIMVTLHSIRLLAEKLKAINLNASSYNQQQQCFNQALHTLVYGIKDYVLAHYATVQRQDSDYWVQARQRAESSPNLAKLLAVWKSGGDFDAYLHNLAPVPVYSRVSWYCLLGGMDYRNPQLQGDFAAPTKELCDAAKAHVQATCEQHFKPYLGARAKA